MLLKYLFSVNWLINALDGDPRELRTGQQRRTNTLSILSFIISILGKNSFAKVVRQQGVRQVNYLPICTPNINFTGMISFTIESSSYRFYQFRSIGLLVSFPRIRFPNYNENEIDLHVRY